MGSPRPAPCPRVGLVAAVQLVDQLLLLLQGQVAGVEGALDGLLDVVVSQLELVRVTADFCGLRGEVRLLRRMDWGCWGSWQGPGGDPDTGCCCSSAVFCQA